MSFGNRCGWIVHRFHNYQQQCMNLLREMDVEDAENTSIPGDWHTWHQWFIYHRHSQPEKQIWFLIQMLEKISLLLSEGDSISWHQRQLEAFLAVLEQQTEGLRSCVTHRMRKNKTMSLYFRQLRDLTHNATGDKQNTWKWIRKQLLDLLALMSLFPAITVD